MVSVKRGLLVAVVLALAGSLSAAAAPVRQSPLVEVIVGLDAPPLALARPAGARGLLSMRSSASRGYLDTLAYQQSQVEDRIADAVPDTAVRWHYRTVL